MPTLYQKYRPQTFSDISGQEHIVQTIVNEIINDKVAHAYLFYGARGIGKTTIARLLSKSINCQERKSTESEPCGQCNSCQEINAGNSIDIIEIDAASHTGVENVRENIIENAQFRPTKSKYKVFIIDEVHMLTNSAFNALLKTLEEPPAHAIFILATTELHKLPATIISRCQRFHFQKIPYKTMLSTLQAICKNEKVDVEKTVLEKIINKSDGALRDAESLLGQILSIDKKKIKSEDVEMILPSSNAQTTCKIIEYILDNKIQENLELLQAQTDEGVNLDQLSFDLLEVLRLMLLIKNNLNNKQTTDYSPEDFKKIKKMADALEMDKLILIIEKLIERKAQIKSSPIPQLPLELFMVETSILNSSPLEGRASPKAMPAERGEEDVVSNIKTSKLENTKTLEHKNTLAQKQIDTSIGTNIQYPISNIQTTEKSRSEDTDVAQATEEPKNKTFQKLKTKISNLKNKKINTTFEQIQDKWDSIKEKISQQNHTLSFVLNMCSLNALEKDKILVSVPYEIHKDKIEENQNKHIIELVLKEEFSESLCVHCLIEEKEEELDEGINNLAVSFGGEVV